MKRYLFLILLSLVGFFDSLYLTYEHFSGRLPPCTVGDCGQVLRSDYALVFGIPLALIGVIYYFLFFCTASVVFVSKSRIGRFILVIQSFGGFLASLYFIYLQLFVIGALCLFCMISALVSTILFVLVQTTFVNERKRLFIFAFGVLYREVIKRIFFLLDPEFVHVRTVRFGEVVGSLGLTRAVTAFFVRGDHPELVQRVAGVVFATPVGLAAGFDYEARLTQTLSSWDFGFQSIGSITNQPYGGNKRPMLGRLPKAKSLMVNKGFKNPGVDAVVRKLEKYSFAIPLGVSVGRTNSKEMITQEESIKDIVSCFTKFEQSSMEHSYYELNISCPNLYGPVSFYPPENLEQLLIAVDSLKISRPIFIKMPIEKTNEETLVMLEIISRHEIDGVIFGNLQKDRKDPALDPLEVSKFEKGGFSGKPTFNRSNELISLSYKHYGKRFIIIGCGGIFSAEEAYEKIQRGATLLQMITGMIYEGPQIVSEINFGLADLLRRDGYIHISQAIGTRKD